MTLQTKEPEQNYRKPVGESLETLWKSRLREMETSIEILQLPKPSERALRQDEEWCVVSVDGTPRRVRFHDYASLYEVPGLYESLFYDRLKCNSPSRVCGLLADVVGERGQSVRDLRVLDLGAGNGMVGDELRVRGADCIVGVDIIPEAREAALRDRDGIYEDYLVADMTAAAAEKLARIAENRLNCLTTVATLGFGDIPPKAFLRALSLISTPGWLAFNIKEEFLSERDPSGFAGIVRQLLGKGVLRMEAYRRYRHRLSVSGDPIYYVALVATKQKRVPASLM
jgi:SAM-dependent methyltransferase